RSRARSAWGVASTAEAGEELAALRQVPVAEGVAGDQGLRRPGPAAQHLVALAEVDLRVLGIREGDEAGIGREIARRPLPDVAEHLMAAEVAHPPRVRSHGRRRERALVEVGQRARWLRVAPGITARGALLEVPRRSLF